MLILNPKQMAIAVKERRVGKKIFIFSIFILIVLVTTSLMDVYLSFMKLIFVDTHTIFDLIFRVTLTISPFIIAYIANNKGDGRDYWYRFININTPITILFILGAIILAVGQIMYSESIISPNIISGWYEYLVSTIVTLIGLIALYYFMNIASRV